MSIKINLTDLLDFEDYGTFREYSGRGMYGKYCLGFECDDVGDLVSMVAAVSEEVGATAEFVEPDDALALFHSRIGDVSSDSMGLSYIFYWRGIEVEDSE